MPPAAWPLASHFNVILQNPQFAFRDAELKQLSIKKDKNGQPRAWSGAFANVYKGSWENGKGSVAIRVFTSASDERRERYQAIAEYLDARQIQSLVRFTYRDDGIRSAGNGKWYPLVTMEWVQGETLQDWVGERCLKKDRKSLLQVSNQWIDIIRELGLARIAHGDLQQGNVMVTDAGQLKLVDYDCMCVPKLVGRKNLEIGVDPYQHPQRNQDTPLSADLDNFSALFILTALKALAASPELWQMYVAQPGYDKLLFRREDLHSPTNSPLIGELKRSPDKEVQRLSRELIDLVQVDIDKVPPLEQFLFSFATVESLLNQRDFDAAVEMLSRNRKQPGDAPPALQPRLRDAQQRVKQRAELETAVTAGDEQGMQRLYLPKLLDDYPRAQPSVAVARLAPKVIPILQSLQNHCQKKLWREFVRDWDANQALLGSRKSAQRFAADAGTWRERNRACDAVLLLAKDAAADAAALSAAWQRLASLGGHPEAEPLRTKVEGLLKRQAAWSAFERVARGADEACDNLLIQAWNETLFAGWNKAERERPRVQQARDRLQLVAQIRQQAAAALTIAGEQTLVRLAGGIPHGYTWSAADRVELARQRLTALERLEQVLRESSDLAIAETAERLEKLQARSLVSPASSPRVLLAESRVPAVTALKKIPPNYPIQQAPQHDPKLLATWKDDLLRDCRDAAAWRPAWQSALRRKEALSKLDAALAKGDKMQVAELVAEDCLQGYPYPPQWGLAVKGALAEVAALRGLLDVLSRNDPLGLSEVFDSRVIRQNASAFDEYRPQLRDWVPAEILPTERLGLSQPVARKGLSQENGSHTAFRICWKWPEPRFNEHCIVAVCKSKPPAAKDPTKLSVHLRMRVDRKSYEEGGGSRVFHAQPDWRGSYVVVWAVIDLGFQSFYSEPLVLGRLESVNGRQGR